MGAFFKLGVPMFLIGAIVGAVGFYLFSPLFIDREVSEELAQGPEPVVLSEGMFRDADRVHKGSGTAQMVRLSNGEVEVQLSNFETTNGPDLYLWLSAHPDPASSADVKGAAFLELGQLKGNIGDQAYSLPSDASVADWKSVVVWCRQFGVLFSPAALSPAG